MSQLVATNRLIHGNEHLDFLKKITHQSPPPSLSWRRKNADSGIDKADDSLARDEYVDLGLDPHLDRAIQANNFVLDLNAAF